ncbi:hypothetical protein [Halorussus salinisoli]|uniref:hypothetical protein n=1 Tax=Halorussus salinisoli TaxID=2558242 RepID=UPI0010C196F8|nr:hypothetical protein [Halorussus salinisoli]
MTRFDAATPEERQKLFAEAITAHRERGSPFATFEADADASALEAERAVEDGETEESAETGDPDEADDPEQAPPWIQFGDGLLNLDCTDAELDALKSVLGEFPAFKIDDLTRPEETEGVNVRVSALADPNRVGQCVERVFREVYDQPEAFRAWVTAV